MTTSAAKAKGRRLQQLVRDDLRKLFQCLNPEIEHADVESRGMGQCGEDIVLSPAARRICNAYVECKNCESLNVSTKFWKHYAKYRTPGALALLVHAKNRTEPTVTLRWADFVPILLAKCTSVDCGLGTSGRPKDEKRKGTGESNNA